MEIRRRRIGHEKFADAASGTKFADTASGTKIRRRMEFTQALPPKKKTISLTEYDLNRRSVMVESR